MNTVIYSVLDLDGSTRRETLSNVSNVRYLSSYMEVTYTDEQGALHTRNIPHMIIYTFEVL